MLRRTMVLVLSVLALLAVLYWLNTNVFCIVGME